MKKSFYMIVAMLLLSGCVGSSKDHIVSAGQTQVQLRSYQSRAFDTADQVKTLRAVIATMQDMGFILDKVDAELGTVSGARHSGRIVVKLTVTVFPKGTSQTQVRANLQRDTSAVETPEPYQNFFVNLEKAMFLTAHGVD